MHSQTLQSTGAIMATAFRKYIPSNTVQPHQQRIYNNARITRPSCAKPKRRISMAFKLFLMIIANVVLYTRSRIVLLAVVAVCYCCCCCCWLLFSPRGSSSLPNENNNRSFGICFCCGASAISFQFDFILFVSL